MLKDRIKVGDLVLIKNLKSDVFGIQFERVYLNKAFEVIEVCNCPSNHGCPNDRELSFGKGFVCKESGVVKLENNSAGIILYENTLSQRPKN